MDNPIISWDEWGSSDKNVEDVIAFVNSVLEEQLKSKHELYFGIVPSEEGMEICFFSDTIINEVKEVKTNMELRIRKDGTILLMGKEIGKAPHTLEKVLKVSLVVAGKEVATKDLPYLFTEVSFDTAQEINEIGLDVYIE